MALHFADGGGGLQQCLHPKPQYISQNPVALFTTCMLTIELLNSCTYFAAFDVRGRCTLRAAAMYALARLGARADEIEAFVQSYDPQLQASPAWQDWPAGEPWAFALGQASAWPQYRDLFFQWLAYEGAASVLSQALPRLTLSCGAAGFDGLLRTAYAVECRHHRELADALAAWACNWQTQTQITAAPAPTGADVHQALVQLPRVASKHSDWMQAMHHAANATPLLRAASALHIGPATLEQLANAGAQAYACSGHAAARALVTSADAMRRILPYVEEPTLALRSYWQDFAAVVAVAGLQAGKAPAPLAWAALQKLARASHDVSTIILVDCCQQTAQAYGHDGWWRSAATRAVQDGSA